MPINIEPYDPSLVSKYVQNIKKMKKPILIHAFLSNSPQSNVFADCYNTGEPAVPEYIFSRFLKNGKVNFLRPNIAYGPVPQLEEISNYLYANGIRKIGYTGNGNTKTDNLKLEASRIKIDWINLNKNNLQQVLTGGPWYLFGENSERLVKSLK